MKIFSRTSLPKLNCMRNALAASVLLSLALSLGATVTGCSRSVTSSSQGGKQKYHCPMHPTYITDRPGDCPICNMKLVPIKGGEAGSKTELVKEEDWIARVRPGQFYCPMEAEHVQDSPGECPICHMDLVEKKRIPVDDGRGDAEGHVHAADEKAGGVPGRVSVALSPERRQMIGLTLATVQMRSVSREVRATALVEHDETKYARVAPRFSGWVRQLHVNSTGAPVRKGQPLFTVYSPELFSAQNEYLVAWRGLQQARDGGSAARRESAEALLEAARLRLTLLQVGEDEIRELERRSKPGLDLLLRAPFSGHVISRNTAEGAAFQAGESLYEISDLSRVWLKVFVFEYELPSILAGQDAVIEFPYLSKSMRGEVAFVYPHIDPQTRAAQIRIELDNPGHIVRPGMWANVRILVDAGKRLTVPASAVINTGRRHVSFVDSGDAHLEPRDVTVGIRTDDYYEVLSGLSEGEQVVTRALFLVDSESQLKAAIAGMGAAGGHEH